MPGKQPFEAVVARHGPTVLRVCRAILGWADADDAWSETFLAAMRAYPALPGDANVEAWLVTMAHHKSIDVTRATARRAVAVSADDDHPPDGVGPGLVAPAADHSAERGEPELWEAVANLPPKQRSAVAYHHVAGLPYREVAEIIGGSVDSARRAAADGIAALRTAVPIATATATPPPTTRRALPKGATR